MRILIVTQYFWPDFRINDFAQGLRDRAHALSTYVRFWKSDVGTLRIYNSRLTNQYSSVASYESPTKLL